MVSQWEEIRKNEYMRAAFGVDGPPVGEFGNDPQIAIIREHYAAQREAKEKYMRETTEEQRAQKEAAKWKRFREDNPGLYAAKKKSEAKKSEAKKQREAKQSEAKKQREAKQSEAKKSEAKKKEKDPDGDNNRTGKATKSVRVRCPQCDKELNKSSLKRHINTQHTADKEKNREKINTKRREKESVRVNCPRCAKEMNKSSLTRHLKTQHKE